MKSQSSKEFKAFVLFTQDTPDHLKALNAAAKSDDVALCLLKGKSDKALSSYKIDPGAKNTVLVYRDRKVTAKFVNWTPKDAQKLQAAIDSTCAAAP